MDRTLPTCCSRPLEVISLAADGDAAVELLRCRTCSRSSWRRGGQVLERSEALGALSQAHARPGQPHRPATRAPRRTPAPAPVRREAAHLTDLLPGWTVLGG
ncbi:MAG: hypothetical protein LC789_07775 [Actinobacteria bacterium]|nr:hypothetical protein [Actinomycetota bacterium]MCA1720336.1 hypothetical protein [Actinomycetota bacterium]